MATAKCPYCNKELEQTPTRKKKCPVCNNYMYVRTQPSNRQKVVVTEEGAKQIDLEWAKIGFKDNRLRQLAEFEITEHDFVRRVGKSIEEASEQEFDDVIWTEQNKLANRYIKDNDFGALKSLYYGMALKLNRQGKDWIKVLQESQKMSLLDCGKYGVIKQVKIFSSDDSCEACRLLHDKIFTIEEALEKMPLPCKECTYKFYTPGDKIGGFCRCMYFGVIE